ncbi:MAG TPA: hypothetical protein ENN13_03580 [Candidatus Altiarchaeales archaeon]|nr:hypothetical protein [Candidatus Altiarchaeales archaeon]
MGLQELESRLRQDAQREKDRIRSEAQETASREREKYAKEVDAAYEKELARGLRLAELSGKKIVAEASVHAAAALSNARHEVMEDVFKKSKERVITLPDSEKKKLLEKWMKSRDNISGKVRVRVDPEYQNLLKKEKDVEILAEKNMGFGLVIESSDGKIRVDCRIDSVISGLKETLKPEVSQIIWGGL